MLHGLTHQWSLSALGCAWATLGMVWLAGIAFTKKTVRRQPTGARIFYGCLAITGFTLLGSNWFATGWFATRILPNSPSLDLLGLALGLAGCAFAIWARITIGANWSGEATVKAGHTLVTAGPYALARHPIYTGLLTASVGTAILVGELRCALGMLLIVLALVVKMSHEEKLMMQTFPEAYPQYRRHVKAIIPGVL